MATFFFGCLERSEEEGQKCSVVLRGSLLRKTDRMNNGLLFAEERNAMGVGIYRGIILTCSA